jgi:hypothetical protein
MKLPSMVMPFAAAALALAAASAPSLADEAPADSHDIVVEGTRQQVRNEIAHLLDDQGEQLARFENGFCPKVIGFDAEWTPKLENLIREDAAAAGIKPDPVPCRPTAVLIFTEAPQELVTGLRTRMPGLFEGLQTAQTSAMVAEARPFYGWRAVDLRDRDGRELQSASSIGSSTWNNSPTHAKIVRNAPNSRLQSAVRYEIVNSYLVADITKTPGMTLGQIADFAALEFLLDLERDAPMQARQDSMLRLFDVADPTTLPPRMSDFERNLLGGLYSQRENNVRANQQRGRIARYIAQADTPAEPKPGR